MFTLITGGPVDLDNFEQSVSRFCKAAGLGHWSIHELRHSCASLLLHEEVPLEVVSEQMGHASIRVTKDVYGHSRWCSQVFGCTWIRTVVCAEEHRVHRFGRLLPRARQETIEPSDDPEPIKSL